MTNYSDESYPSTLTFVNCEGVQSAPLQLPAGQHSLVFLTALETGLAPSLRLDPPLWAGHGKGMLINKTCIVLMCTSCSWEVRYCLKNNQNHMII